MNLLFSSIQIKPYMRKLIFVGILLLPIAFLLNQGTLTNKPVALKVYIGKACAENEELIFSIESENTGYRFQSCKLEMHLEEKINPEENDWIFSLVNDDYKVQVRYDNIIYSFKNSENKFTYSLEAELQEEINRHLSFGEKVKILIGEDIPKTEFFFWFLVPLSEAKPKPTVYSIKNVKEKSKAGKSGQAYSEGGSSDLLLTP